MAIGGAFLAVALFSQDVQGGNQCVVNCNRQYQATVKYCAEVVSKNPSRKDWYGDCIKNAKKFRRECLHRCK
jgi:hypothetical protein